MNVTMSKLCAFFGMTGGAVASAFGGWDRSLSTLLMFMAIDYVTGILLSLVFHKSNKTDDGGYLSSVGAKGIVKKFMVIILVFVAHRIDIALNVSYLRDTLSIAFIVNEALSIVENAGLMGVPVPDVLMNGITVLKGKSSDTTKKEEVEQ